MGYKIVHGDITEVKADIIVNVSYGIGFMGGLIGKFINLKGVAETIHYETTGVVENEGEQMHTFRQIKEYDTIIYNENIRTHIHKIMSENQVDIPVNSILNEGVIKTTDISDCGYMYTYFKQIGERNVEFEVYLYNRDQYEYNYTCTFVSNYTNSSSEQIITDWNTKYEWNLQQKQEITELCNDIFIGITAYINYLSLYTKVELKDLDGNHVKLTKRKKNVNQVSQNRKHIVDINGIRIISNDPLRLVNLVKKEIKRHTESWTVRGHYRHLKNGKISFVKSYTKGDKTKFRGKIYEVSDSKES